MAAIVTDQFRIANATNFVNSVGDPSNSYYVFVSLPNPAQVGFGRDPNWNTNIPNPIDSLDYMNHYHDTMLFGKLVNKSNVRRLVRRIDWSSGTKYEMYRNDYSILNPSPITQSYRLYDANYYVLNSDYRVYICIDNGSSGINTTGNASQDQPTFTDLEPSSAGVSGDGYVWKYLFTVSPSDIIKFDSTEYITVPNDWTNSSDPSIQAVRQNADSSVNLNQIKKVYIKDGGQGYSGGLGQQLNVLGDGSGATVLVDVVSGSIAKTTVTSGGSGYTYGIVDTGSIDVNASRACNLIPVIPPSNGHGFDLYKELGTDKVLVYARFDDSSKDFPIDTKFAQVGIIKNPTSFGSTSNFTDTQFSSLYGLKLSTYSGTISVGDVIKQSVTGGTALGYVASFDTQTNVLKYFRDRSLYFNPTTQDQTDYIGISTGSKVLNFESSSNAIFTASGFQAAVDVNFTGITTNPTGNALITLGMQFTNGLGYPDINKSSGEIIYLDNRPLISRNTRQKEDVKIILEF
jgi:hypothetical protein